MPSAVRPLIVAIQYDNSST